MRPKVILNKWLLLSLCILLLVLVGSFSLKHFLGYYIPVPAGIRHLANMVFSPDDMYEPIVLDRFAFWERDFTKTYALHPKYFGIYAIGIFIEDGAFEKNFKFNGKVNIGYYYKDKLLYEEVISSHRYASYAGKSMTHYSKVCLHQFDVPLKDIYAKNISVCMTVLEPDENLEKYKDSLRVYISLGML